MTGNLNEILETLVTNALPTLFGGANPAVSLSITSDLLEFNPESADALASEPRPDDRRDSFPFDSLNPVGPYTLTHPPYPGPRRVYLTTDIGDRISLKDNEVNWDEEDSRIFTLNLRSTRELTNITGIEVLYGVTAVFTKIKALQTLSLELKSSDTPNLEQAEALVVSVIELNRQHFMEDGQALYEDGVYSAHIEVKSLKFIKGTCSADNQRQLTYQVEIELKVSRALRDDEGKPIKYIRTPGRPVDLNRPVDIHIDVD